jgi:ParB family chromosome partitioning protein
MQVLTIDINELKPYENNPRYNDSAAEQVAESIKNFGFRVPILIDKDYTIVSGHSRYKASKILNLKEVPCIIVEDLTEKQIKAFRIADNKVSETANWDFFSLAKEIKDLKMDNMDLDFTGFDLREIDNILDLIMSDDEEQSVSTYKPVLDPKTSQSFVSDIEVRENQSQIDNKFKAISAPKHNVFICPHCGLEFETD